MIQLSLLDAPNRLFELARTGHLRLLRFFSESNQRFVDGTIYPIAALLFAFMTPVIAGVLAALPLTLVLLLENNGNLAAADFTSIPFSTLLMVNFIPIYLLVWVWLYVFEDRHLWTVGLEWSQGLYRYLRGLLIGFGMITAVILLFALFGIVQVESIDPNFAPGTTLNAAIIMLIAWMIQGGAEEVLARGFLMPVIGVRWGTAVGVVISSLLFAALHLLNANLSVLGVVNLALFGLFAAIFALYEGSIWGIAAIHSAWNWAQGNFFGFEVSGVELESGIMFNLMETGPDWLTGGAFGPEGGLVATAVLLVSIALVLFAFRRRQPPVPPSAPAA